MSFFTNDDKIEEIRDIRRESSKPKPKKAAEPQAATTRSALKNKARCAFKTARQPLNFSGARKTPKVRIITYVHYINQF